MELLTNKKVENSFLDKSEIRGFILLRLGLSAAFGIAMFLLLYFFIFDINAKAGNIEYESTFAEMAREMKTFDLFNSETSYIYRREAIEKSIGIMNKQYVMSYVLAIVSIILSAYFLILFELFRIGALRLKDSRIMWLSSILRSQNINAQSLRTHLVANLLFAFLIGLLCFALSYFLVFNVYYLSVVTELTPMMNQFSFFRMPNDSDRMEYIKLLHPRMTMAYILSIVVGVLSLGAMTKKSIEIKNEF